MSKVKQFLDYCTMHNNPVLIYKASDIALALHSDADDLNEQNARSLARGYCFLSDDVKFPPKIVSCSTWHELSKQLCLQLQRLRLVHCISVQDMWYTSAWPFAEKRCQFKPIMESLTTSCNQNVLRPWTCICTGCGIGRHRSS